MVEAEVHLERPRLLFVGDLLGGEEPTGLRDFRVRGGQAVDFGDDGFDRVFRAVFVHGTTMTGAETDGEKNLQESFFGDSWGRGARTR